MICLKRYELLSYLLLESQMLSKIAMTGKSIVH